MKKKLIGFFLVVACVWITSPAYARGVGHAGGHVGHVGGHVGHVGHAEGHTGHVTEHVTEHGTTGHATEHGTSTHSEPIIHDTTIGKYRSGSHVVPWWLFHSHVNQSNQHQGDNSKIKFDWFKFFAITIGSILVLSVITYGVLWIGDKLGYY